MALVCVGVLGSRGGKRERRFWAAAVVLPVAWICRCVLCAWDAFGAENGLRTYFRKTPEDVSGAFLVVFWAMRLREAKKDALVRRQPTQTEAPKQGDAARLGPQRAGWE